MTTKHVLVVAYHFPPIGGAGAQRPARLAGHLVEEGYSSTVITGPGPGVGRWTPEDAALGHEIPASINVLRLDGPEPGAGNRWSGRRDRWLARPTAWAQMVDRRRQPARASGRGRRSRVRIHVAVRIRRSRRAPGCVDRATVGSRSRRPVGAGRDDDLPHAMAQKARGRSHAPLVRARRRGDHEHARGGRARSARLPGARAQADDGCTEWLRGVRLRGRGGGT